MDIISYNITKNKLSYKLVNNVVFKDKNWFKSTFIETLEKNRVFMHLEDRVKTIIKNIFTVDIVDSNSVFCLYESNNTYLKLDNEQCEVFLMYNLPAYPINTIVIFCDDIRYGFKVNGNEIIDSENPTPATTILKNPSEKISF
jgi:hypothetical protein